MLTKNEIKFIQSLHTKKGREQELCFVAEGTKVVEEIVTSSYQVRAIYTTEIDHNYPENSFIISSDELKKISALVTPNKVVCVVKMPRNEMDLKSFTQGITLVLDQVSDPGNMGTIIRVADWFGIKNIVCSESCVDAFSPKVVQASMGSFLRVNIFYTSLLSFLKEIKSKNVLVAGATLDGDSLYEKKLPSNFVMVMGSESHGISEEVLALLDNKIKIPSYSSNAESLNVAVAAAIICAECRRN